MPVYTYNAFDVPLALDTEPLGINDSGQIVGQYRDSGGVHSFLFSGGTFTAINDPSATGPTFAYGINDAGQIVGYYTDSGNKFHGFLYNPTNGSFTTLDDPLATGGTTALGINDKGDIVGSFNNGSHGFLYRNGAYITLDDPLATNST